MENVLQVDETPNEHDNVLQESVDKILDAHGDTNRKLGEVIKGFWPLNRKLSWTLVFTILFGSLATFNQIGWFGKPLFWGDARSLERKILRAERAVQFDCNLQNTVDTALALANEGSLIGKTRLQERALGLAMAAQLTLDEVEPAYKIWADAREEGLTPYSPASKVRLQSREQHFDDLYGNMNHITAEYASENVVLGAPVYRIASLFSDNPVAIEVLTESGYAERQTLFRTHFAQKGKSKIMSPSWSEIDQAIQSDKLCRAHKFWMVNRWSRDHKADLDLIAPAIPHIERLAKTDLEFVYSKATIGDFAYRSEQFTEALSELENFQSLSYVDEQTKFMVARRKVQSKMVLAMRCYKDTEELVEYALSNEKAPAHHHVLKRLVERCIDDWGGQARAVELYDQLIEATPSLNEKDLDYLICNALNDVGEVNFRSREICREIQTADFKTLSYKQAESRVIWAYRKGDYDEAIDLIDRIFSEDRFTLGDWNIGYLKARRGLSNFYLENFNEAQNDILSALNFYTEKEGQFTQWQTTLYRHLLLIYAQQGDAKLTLETSDRLWGAVSETGNVFDKVRALEYVVLANQDAGQIQETYEHALQWVELTKGRTHRKSHFNGLSVLGNAQIRLGQNDGVDAYLSDIDVSTLSEYGLWLKDILELVSYRVSEEYDFVDSRLSPLVQSPLALRDHSYEVRSLIATLTFDNSRYDITRLRDIDPICVEVDLSPLKDLNMALCDVLYAEEGSPAVFKKLKDELSRARQQGWVIGDDTAGFEKYLDCFDSIVGEFSNEVFYQKSRGCMIYLKQGLFQTGQTGSYKTISEHFDRNAATLGLPPINDLVGNEVD